MIFCATFGSDQMLGSSARAFSSARRSLAISGSKIPPEQAERFADGFGVGFGFGAHGMCPVVGEMSNVTAAIDLRPDPVNS
jgi:hypothetical protein